ncbi:MAG: hypothetical protein KC897_02350 [Candidatus Omnitrophica bacterium]|nr:hypothetical protein [Candidatus Omnitrophota bacterium]MCB9721055.1 hypothetical protein [Candidatus Omnitrophota bacterium]
MTSFIFNFKRWPKALLLCLALLYLTELYVSRNVYKLRTPSLSALVYKQYRLEHGPALDHDMIIMGDSRYMGLNAKWFEEDLSAALGRNFSVYNYAMLNQGIRSYTLLLRKYLRRHRPPKYILFGSAPLAITGAWAAEKVPGRNESLHYLAQMYSLPELLGVFPVSEYGRLVTVKLERLFNLVLYRSAIKKAIKSPGYFYKDYMTPAVRFLDKNNGGLIIGGFVAVTEDEVRASEFFDLPLKADPDMDYWYQEFFRVARENGITVLLANSPTTQILYDRREAIGSNEHYRQLVARWEHANSNLHTIPPLLQPYPINEFKDWHHLNLDGTNRYVEGLIATVVHEVKMLERGTIPARPQSR